MKQTKTKKTSEFHPDYKATVAKYVQKLAQQNNRQLSILDLNAGGPVTEGIVKQLVDDGIKFRMQMINFDYFRLCHTSDALSDFQKKAQLSYLHRDLTDVNIPLTKEGILDKAFNRHPSPEEQHDEITRELFKKDVVYAGRYLAGVSPIDEATKIPEGSIDMLIGNGPFSFLPQDNYKVRVRTAVNTASTLLRKDGYAVFTAGFNLPKEIKANGRPLALGARQAELDKHFQAEGLVLQEGPRLHTIEGFSPFHYMEVFAYRKGTSPNTKK